MGWEYFIKQHKYKKIFFFLQFLSTLGTIQLLK